MPLRVADVTTLTGVCRSHPLWERRFSHQWAAIRNMAGCACTVVSVNIAQKTVAVDWDDDEAVDMASATPGVGRKLSSKPQFPFAALESRNPNRPPSMQVRLGKLPSLAAFCPLFSIACRRALEAPEKRMLGLRTPAANAWVLFSDWCLRVCGAGFSGGIRATGKRWPRGV